MRISQLSDRAGLPVGTVKFYLRTGLLHHGFATSATQALYDDTHLERLRLVRALLEVGRLSHADIQRVLNALGQAGDEPLDAIETFGRAAAPLIDGIDEEDLAAARSVTAELGWQISPDSPHLPDLARCLAALHSVGVAPSRERVRTYAEAASHVARHDLQAVADSDERSRPVEAVMGATLYDNFFSSLHRLAVENQVSRQRSRVPAPRVSVPSA
jgi:DNA-binding transcriptional MerR regulator